MFVDNYDFLIKIIFVIISECRKKTFFRLFLGAITIIIRANEKKKGSVIRVLLVDTWKSTHFCRARQKSNVFPFYIIRGGVHTKKKKNNICYNYCLLLITFLKFKIKIVFPGNVDRDIIVKLLFSICEEERIKKQQSNVNKRTILSWY